MSEQINSAFLSMMQNHRRGSALTELSEAMQKVTQAVMEAGKGGSFSLKVTIKPATTGGALVVLDEIKTSLPKGEPQGSIFFADLDNNFALLRDNPKQLSMDLKTVDGGVKADAPLKAVNQ